MLNNAFKLMDTPMNTALKAAGALVLLLTALMQLIVLYNYFWGF